MNKMDRINKEATSEQKYDLAGQAIGSAMKVHNEGLLLNFGAAGLEYKKKFRTSNSNESPEHPF